MYQLYFIAGIIFLLNIFAVCDIVLLYFCSLGVCTIMSMILVMSLISILCTSLTLRTKYIPWYGFEHYEFFLVVCTIIYLNITVDLFCKTTITATYIYIHITTYTLYMHLLTQSALQAYLSDTYTHTLLLNGFIKTWRHEFFGKTDLKWCPGELLLKSALYIYPSPLTSTWPHLNSNVGLEKGEY